MKTIKLQEKADQQKQEGKQTKVAEPVAKTKQEIDEEMPLKVKGTLGGRSRRSNSKESKPSMVLDSNSSSLVAKSTENIGSTAKKGVVKKELAKKDAVFFK